MIQFSEVDLLDPKAVVTRSLSLLCLLCMDIIVVRASEVTIATAVASLISDPNTNPETRGICFTSDVIILARTVVAQSFGVRLVASLELW